MRTEQTLWAQGCAAPFNLPPHGTLHGTQTVMTRADARRLISQVPMDGWLEQTNYAAAHYVCGSLDTALHYAEKAVRTARNSSTLLNLAVILEAYGRFEAALALGLEALPADRENILLGGLVADGLLRLDRWAEGWPLYTYYHTATDWLSGVLPEWNGRASLRGRRLLVLEGGGFGDTFYFLRHLVRLASWGARIAYAGPPSIIPLVVGQPYIAAGLPTVDGRLTELPVRDFDCFVPILALGERLGLTPTDVLWRGPYIAAGPPRPCPLAATRPRVGLCWRAGEGNYPRPHRTLSDRQRDRLTIAGHPRVQWANLTLGCDWADADWQPSLSDWTATAAAIAPLDLVVTVDTSVAHLAGALGKPTWVILPGASAWQYGVDREMTPLYPSMRLYRNPGPGIDSALEACAAALEAL